MNAMTPIDQVKHWQDQITALEAKIKAQGDRITEAQQAASEAALNDADTDTAVREVSHQRDVLDAQQAALGEARRHLRHAEESVAQAKRDDALARAKIIARKRLDAADELDEFMGRLDGLIDQWSDLGADLAAAMVEAGMRPPSAEGKAYRVRAGAWTNSPTFMSLIDAARVHQDHRIPFRQLTAAQSAPVLSKGD